MSPNRSIIALGLPEAGKSTFLAALGYQLQYPEPETELRLHKLSPDMSEIKPLIDEWLACKKPERTKGTTPKNIEFILQSSGSGDLLGEVWFPDVSGETYEQQWATRVLEASYVELVDKLTGLLVFIHPQHIVKPFSIADRVKLDKAAGVDDNDNDEEKQNEQNTSEQVPARLFEPVDAAPQVKIVDLIQMVLRTAPTGHLRVGLVVSAWDEVVNADKKETPKKWIARSVPLLFQFMTSNPESFTWEAFGVSAIGGNLKTDFKKLLDYEKPAKRPFYVRAEQSANDLTAILKWALG